MKNQIIKWLLLILAACLLLTACEHRTVTYEETQPVETEPTLAVPADGLGRPVIEPKKGEPKKFTVCVDPGHGFWDGGAGQLPDGTYLYEDQRLEKDITMAIATKVRDALELEGFDVILTHDGVTTPAGDTNSNHVYSIDERCVAVNQTNVGYFISIHADYSEEDSVYGIRLYHMQHERKINDHAAAYAEAIAASIREKMTGEDPQLVDQTNDIYNSFAAVRETKMPAVLIEVGFISNEADRAKVVSEDWQQQFAEAVAAGVTKAYESLGEDHA